jgi:hypothetical protein
MQRNLLDSQRRTGTMGSAGGEDTALLRSNRSAHAGAGTQAGVCRSGRLLPSPMRAMRSGHKATNLGVWGRAPRQHPGAVGHMARCVGCELLRNDHCGHLQAKNM